jgi:hypothetical protein
LGFLFWGFRFFSSVFWGIFLIHTPNAFGSRSPV